MRRLRRTVLALGLLLVGLAVGFTGFQLWWLSSLMGELQPPTPARRYFARPVILEPGLAIEARELEQLLEASGYREDASGGAGSFRWSGSELALTTRSGDRPPGQTLRLTLAGGRLASAPAVTLAPLAFAEDASDGVSRRWVPLEAMPTTLLRLVQAVEDRRFGEHRGFDWRGIVRALWVNLRAGRWVEGGSTITQQLVKDRYLGSQRRLWRKYNEALLAVLLERRFGKAAILEAYLNDAYLGQAGSAEIRGFPRAAEHYFGRRLADLAVQELALLVGLLRGPSWYQPWRHPERARARRNRVLDALWRTGWLPRARLEALGAMPLGLASPNRARGRQRFPAYLDLVRRQLRRSEGAPVQLPTALDLRIQLAAERALAGALGARETPNGDARRQGAVVVADRRSGELVAAVGGVPVAYPGFNRTIDARRQVGSVIKPIYYRLALAGRGHHLLSPLDDGPLAVPLAARAPGPAREPWRPENFDGRDAGTLPLVEALARSRNRASVRLGLELGLPAVVRALARLGLQREVELHPSLLLGALELAPLEVAQLYLSLARGGEATALTAIARRPLRAPAADPASYLLEAGLIRAMESGTGRSFAPAAAAELAGKTGTSNDGRDAWFAGWTATHVVVVWVGRDDNAPARLTGAGAAGPVVAALAPAILAGPVQGAPPPGVALYPVDLPRGRRIDGGCPRADHLPFVAARLPRRTVPCPE